MPLDDQYDRGELLQLFHDRRDEILPDVRSLKSRLQFGSQGSRFKEDEALAKR